MPAAAIRSYREAMAKYGEVWRSLPDTLLNKDIIEFEISLEIVQIFFRALKITPKLFQDPQPQHHITAVKSYITDTKE